MDSNVKIYLEMEWLFRELGIINIWRFAWTDMQTNFVKLKS